jgi:hypothetical protein
MDDWDWPCSANRPGRQLISTNHLLGPMETRIDYTTWKHCIAHRYLSIYNFSNKLTADMHKLLIALWPKETHKACGHVFCKADSHPNYLLTQKNYSLHSLFQGLISVLLLLQGLISVLLCTSVCPILLSRSDLWSAVCCPNCGVWLCSTEGLRLKSGYHVQCSISYVEHFSYYTITFVYVGLMVLCIYLLPVFLY